MEYLSALLCFRQAPPPRTGSSRQSTPRQPSEEPPRRGWPADDAPPSPQRIVTRADDDAPCCFPGPANAPPPPVPPLAAAAAPSTPPPRELERRHRRQRHHRREAAPARARARTRACSTCARRPVAAAAPAPGKPELAPGKPQRRKMKADADALPKPTGVAWAPLVALMPVPGAASLAAFEAKLAETCAGPNVKDDAPRDAAKARRRAGLERLSKATQEGHTILHHVVVNADEVAADALRRSLGAARWHALAEAPANDGRSARRLSRRLGRKRMQDVFDRYEAQYEAKVAKAKARAKEATRAAERDTEAARRATSARAAAREAESARRPEAATSSARAAREAESARPEAAAAAKEDVEVRLKALQKLEASIDATTAWDAEMVGKVDKALSAFGGGCLDPRVGAAVARIRASASAARRAAAIGAAAAPAAAPARDSRRRPRGLCALMFVRAGMLTYVRSLPILSSPLRADAPLNSDSDPEGGDD